MARITEDPSDPDLGADLSDRPTGMHKAYLVLSQEERAKGFVRPLRTGYIHRCGGATWLATEIAETYARKPSFYTATFCAHCDTHFPLPEFKWFDGSVVGS